MLDDPFHKWWPCLKKHFKRRTFWLPEVKRIHAELMAGRDFRYFTLCARPMIDVYMLVKEKVLPYDVENRRISGVCFCECVESVIGEMRELIGVEESGFCGFLEDLVLFSDSPITKKLVTEAAISNYLEGEGEGIPEVVRKEILLKRAHMNFRKQFPFDFINLDYCDPYYGTPPNVLRVHQAVEQILAWQTQDVILPDKSTLKIDRFVLAITCRTDDMIDASAKKRLAQIIEDNCNTHPKYLRAVKARIDTDISSWQEADGLDFFMSAWPKEIARVSNKLGWEIEIKSHSFYEREDSSGKPYNMVCLVAEFVRSESCSTYLPAALKCLDPDSRSEIREIGLADKESGPLVDDLTEIVTLRNKQAEKHGIPLLPEPRSVLAALASGTLGKLSSNPDK